MPLTMYACQHRELFFERVQSFPYNDADESHVLSRKFMMRRFEASFGMQRLMLFFFLLLLCGYAEALIMISHLVFTFLALRFALGSVSRTASARQAAEQQ